MSLAAALLMLAAGPSTDPVDGPRLGSRVQPQARVQMNAAGEQNPLAVYRFLDCAATRRPERAQRILDTRTEDGLREASGALHDVQRCNLGAYVAEMADIAVFDVDSGSMRGLLAEIFLKRTGKAASLTPLPIQRTYDRDWYAMTGRARQLDEMATCVADTDPAGISAVLNQEIGSPEEKTAFSKLVGSLGPCLATGYKLTADRLALRAVLAEALYHRAFDPASAAPAAAPQAESKL
jgi:hypothetical protein